MLKAIRYTLAAICLAASVGCLALWWRSHTTYVCLRLFDGGSVVNGPIELEAVAGYGQVGVLPSRAGLEVFEAWESEYVASLKDDFRSMGQKSGDFGQLNSAVHFPLWFPALVFALAAVAAIRVGRHFTLRSALVGMSVVAALLGMMVAL